MRDTEIEDLIRAARSVQGTLLLRQPDFAAASVGAALRTTSGNVYTGVCVDVGCGIGFCAEHGAIAEMLKHREVEIASIVAVDAEKILPPCGRCREFMAQLSERNAETRVVLAPDRVEPLRRLLPEHWLSR